MDYQQKPTRPNPSYPIHRHDVGAWELAALRDLFGFRLALRCNTPQASDTILGQGWATAGYSASSVAPGQRGVGYLLADDGLPVRVRGFYLPDEQITRIAERASALRADAWLAAEEAAS